MIRKAKLEEITALNNIIGEGRMACGRILNGYFLRQAIEKATTFEDLKEILLVLNPTPPYFLDQHIQSVIK